MSGSIELDNHWCRLDSIYRFISSQNTSHSNYLLVYALATVTYSVAFVTQEASRTILILTSIPFALFGIWLVGRLLYYIELGNVTQHFMGLTDHGVLFYQQYAELSIAERERKRGLLNIIANILFCRISYSLGNHFDFKDYENFKEVTSKLPISKLKALLIACAKVNDVRYRIVLVRFNRV